MKFVLTLIFIILGTFNHCTGANIGTAPYGLLPRTNPAPEYTDLYKLIYRGGWVYHNNTIPGQLGNDAFSKLRGESCSRSVLWLVSWGDSSIETAKRSGKITKVASTEFEQFAIFGFLYHSLCIIVTGEGDSTSNTPSASELKEPAKTPGKQGK
jgi:hypothetical protein